jgi:glycosyltransferase involved in cell wall biosynthesis
MRIAIDLSTLQTGHRMRGIGAVLINFINHLPAQARKQYEFVFFLNPGDDNDVLEPLDLDDTNYTIEYLRSANHISTHLPSKLNLIVKALNKFIAYVEFRSGDSRITSGQLDDVDAYLQFDQSQKLPAGSEENTYVVLYDLIPYVMESDYLWSYDTARRNGRTRRSALKSAVKRRQYISKLKITCRRAKHLIAISEHTKDDFVKHVGVSPSKISIALLGADSTPSDTAFTKKDAIFSAYKPNSWGPIPRATDLSQQPFLLFMGGADPRRRLVELAAAYNNMRSRGIAVSLVLAGDTMHGADRVPHIQLQEYLKTNASYIDDIHFVGFVTDRQKEWLYKHALAYVYPSVYEGFGLPVLEAMQHGTPVITYNNSSIAEIAGKSAFYAANFQDIASHATTLLSNAKLRSKYHQEGMAQAEKFTWKKTTEKIISIVQL